MTAHLASDAERRVAPARDGVLAFHEPGGPLVAICGLVGGAGTSTLAYLLARRAARHSSAPVLLTELDDNGGLAALAGASAPLGLRDLAEAVDEDRPPARPFAQLPGGLRLVATDRPGAHGGGSRAALGRVLGDARELHGLVVVDAGVLPSYDSTVLFEHATQVLFTLPAALPALQRAELAAEQGVFQSATGRATALVAVALQPSGQAVDRPLRKFAAAHVDCLLLVPHIEELVRGDLQLADARMDNTFAALATLLRRAA